MLHARCVDTEDIKRALDEVFDQAVVFDGFVDYMRDYDVYIHATANPRTGIAPERFLYRFTHCVHSTVTAAVRRDVWPRSLGDQFTDHKEWLRSGAPQGFVLGVSGRATTPACN